MKKLILILALMFCLIFSGTAFAYEKVDISGAGFDTDVIFRAKIVEFLEQLNFTELAITDALGNARQIHWQFTATSIEGGEHLTGIQLRSNWGGTADSPTAGITGIEIKARSASDSITHTLGTAKAIIANVDVKKATFTVAHVFEGQVDVSSGGEITTLKNFRASLNNSGTIGTSYAFIVETANTALNWDYGFYMADNQADVGMYLGSCTTGIDFNGTFTGVALNVGDASARLAYTDSGVPAAGIYTNFTLAAAGTNQGLKVDVVYTPTTATGIGSVYGTYSRVEVATEKILNDASYQQIAGVRGHVEITGSLSGAGIWISGVLGSVGPSAPTALTTFKTLACFTAMTLFQVDPGTGDYAGFLVANAGGYRYDYGFLALEAVRYGVGIRPNKADSVLESAFIVDATNVDLVYQIVEVVDVDNVNYFLKTGATTDLGFMQANTATIDDETLQHVIVIDVGGNPGYIPVYNVPPS